MDTNRTGPATVVDLDDEPARRYDVVVVGGGTVGLGVSDHWGIDVLQCPYCHGREVRDHPRGVGHRPHVGAPGAAVASVDL